MAKKKYNKSNHYSNESKKGIVAAMGAVVLSAVLLVGGGAVGYGMGTHWTYDRNQSINRPSDDGNDNNDGGTVNKPDGELNGNDLISTPTNSDLLKMAVMPLMEADANGAEKAVENSCVLIASNDSGDASLDTYIWSSKFENASSSWANGKKISDYLEITTSSDTKQQTIRAKQAFGEPIIITVASTVNSEATATCRLDYVKRISSVTWKINNNDCLVLGETNAYNLTPSYGVGTVTGTVAVNTVKARLSQQINSDIAGAFSSKYGGYASEQTANLNADEIINPKDFIYINNSMCGGWSEAQHWNETKLAINKIIQGGKQSFGNKAVFYVTVSVTYSYNYNGAEYQTGTTSDKQVSFDTSNCTEYSVVTNVDLNKPNHAFRK